MIISCCTVGCDRFRIGDVVLITDLYHLPAALYGYQEFTAQIGAVCIIIQRKAHRNRSPRQSPGYCLSSWTILPYFIRINIIIAIISVRNTACRKLADNLIPADHTGSNGHRPAFCRYLHGLYKEYKTCQYCGCDSHHDFIGTIVVFFDFHLSSPLFLLFYYLYHYKQKQLYLATYTCPSCRSFPFCLLLPQSSS